jgi:hypothetical protein
MNVTEARELTQKHKTEERERYDSISIRNKAICQKERDEFNVELWFETIISPLLTEAASNGDYEMFVEISENLIDIARNHITNKGFEVWDSTLSINTCEPASRVRIEGLEISWA